MLRGEGQGGEHIVLGRVHQLGQPRPLRPEPVRHSPPLLARRGGIGLGNHRADGGRHQRLHPLRHQGQGIAHKVNWLNIYARYDPVPRGAPPAELVERLVGRDPVAHGQTGHRPPYVNLRVANDDLPLTDHGGYWWNFEESLSRIVHVICDSSLGTAPLDPDTQPDPPGHLLGTVVRDTLAQGDRRRTELSRKQFRRLVGLALAALVLGFWALPVGAWLLGDRHELLTIDWRYDARRWLGEKVPHHLGSVSFRAARNWLAGALVVAQVALMGSLVVALVRDFRSHRATENDAEPVRSVKPVRTTPQRIER